MHSRAPVRTLDFDSIGELGICFAVPLDKPCCVWGSYFHEGTAVPLRAAVELLPRRYSRAIAGGGRGGRGPR